MQDIIVPPLNKEAAEIVHKNWQAVDEVPYQLGKVEKMVEKYAAICGTPDFEGKIKSAMLLMCGDHGIAVGLARHPAEAIHDAQKNRFLCHKMKSPLILNK